METRGRAPPGVCLDEQLTNSTTTTYSYVCTLRVRYEYERILIQQIHLVCEPISFLSLPRSEKSPRVYRIRTMVGADGEGGRAVMAWRKLPSI